MAAGAITPPRHRFTPWEGAVSGLLLALLLYLCNPLPLESLTVMPLVDPAGVLQVFPWVSYNISQFKLEYPALWNPLTGLGEPHLANIQTAVLFPLYWLWHAAGGGETAYALLLLFRAWLAGFLWFAFARRRLTGFFGALVCGAAYGVSGYTLWFLQLIDLNSQMLLPALLLALPSLLDRPRMRMLALSAALVALVILGGHPEAAFVTLFVALAFTACARATGQGRAAGGAAVVAALVLGGLFALAAELPFLNYLSRCWTMHGSGFGFVHLDPRGFFNLIVPGVYALFADMPREIPVETTQLGLWEAFLAPYRDTAAPGNLPGAGLVVCALAMVALARPRRLGWPALFFVGLLAFTLGMTFGLPGFRLFTFIPPFNMNSNFKFFFSEIHASLAVLAGAGAETLLAATVPINVSRKNILPSILTLCALALLMVVAIFLPDMVLNPDLPGLLSYGTNVQLAFLSVSTLAIGLIARRWSRADWRPALLGVVALALLFNGSEVRPFVVLSPDREEWGPLAAEVKKRISPEGRVQGIDGFWPANLAMAAGIKDLRSSDALFYQPYMDELNRVNRLTPAQSLRFFYPSYYTRVSAGKILSPEAAGLGIRLVVSDQPWLPHSILDHALSQGRSIYSEHPTSYNMRQGLFLHAPAMISIPLSEAPGDLAFLPRGACKGDGAFFQVMQGGPAPGLAYSRFHTDCRPPDVVARLNALEARLSTLPGPRDNRDSDWATFSRISWHPGGYRPPPEPVWTDGQMFLYRADGLPWAHLEGATAALRVERAAGDKVGLDLTGAGPGTAVIHEAWYPGWTAEVDGRPAAIEPGPGKVSWRLPVVSGARRAVFRFAPADFRVGLFVSLASALLCLVLTLFRKT